MLESYLEVISLTERLHRQFLDVLKIELEQMGLRDINNVQAMILFNIGGDELTVGELTQRGYYLGSNVSYNLKKMVEAGYVEHMRSAHDRRTVRIALSEKGRTLWSRLDGMFARHAEVLSGHADENSLQAANLMLRGLERFWGDLHSGAARPSFDVQRTTPVLTAAE